MFKRKLKSFNKFFFSGDRSLSNNLTFLPAVDTETSLAKKMKQYFDANPHTAQHYSAELTFLNNKVSLMVPQDRLLYSIMPYEFTLSYEYSKVVVFLDEEVDLYYVLLDGKRLYYHRGYRNVESVQKSFTYISVEQDPHSPHRYLTKDFDVRSSDVVADLGAAEGNFGLMVVDRVKKLIVVEADEIWKEALQKTFEPWRDKVTIHTKAVGQINGTRGSTLFELFGEQLPDFIKMDIEGNEFPVLQQAKNLLLANGSRFAIATYHNHDDEVNIRNILENCGYVVIPSDGHILFIYDQLNPPYFRKGLIRATKSGK